MTHFTGYLLGKVQLDGAIRSEVLASLVETLLQRYQPSDPAKKHIKFHESNKYSVECSERGLKLTSPGFKSKDEGFESDCESVRSVKMSEAGELDLSDLMTHLEISKDEKETESGSHVHSSLSSSGASMDNASISSSSGLHVSDDSNSSSGNGSDSDEFCASGERSPYWETLPNLSSFQSYPIEDVVFCHCDATHPSTLVWVVRHLAKMMALVTAFRTRSEAEDLFQMYRDLRLKLKPVKYKINPILGTKLFIPPAPCSPAPSPPSSSSSSSSSCAVAIVSSSATSDSEGNGSNSSNNASVSSSSSSLATYTSLPPVYHSEMDHPSKSNMFSFEPKSLDFELDSAIYNDTTSMATSSSTSTFTSSTVASKEPSSSFNSLSLRNYHHSSAHPHSQHIFANANPNILRYEGLPSTTSSSSGQMHQYPHHQHENDEHGADFEVENEENESEEIHTEVEESNKNVVRAQRKIYSSGGSTTSKSALAAKLASKPVLLVPLKTESVTTPRSSYPKESYLYHVMGRSSSTFAPYQRSLNFLPTQFPMSNNGNPAAGGDYLGWGNGRHLLVPFSSWLELSEMPKIPHAVTSSSRKVSGQSSKTRMSPRTVSRGSALATVSGKGGTSKILLRDSSGRDHGVWATLSQRFKRNFRDNLMPKLNGMWSQQAETSRQKKKSNKKVTFNAWATVQMV